MGNKTNHAEPMDPEEVMRRAEAFAPTPAEQFVSWATEVGECLAIQGCSCNGCATVAREVKAAKVMRLALQMIVAQCNCYTEHRAHIVDPIRRTAQQALRECGK
jgi:hypothetical protein